VATEAGLICSAQEQNCRTSTLLLCVRTWLFRYAPRAASDSRL